MRKDGIYQDVKVVDQLSSINSSHGILVWLM
nr:MAG TPA_asm: hypothetical protein [Bacteriophage sp.]DAP05617.1 MAG TPA: hypothetical protein [Caudoviricetes sp.]